MTTFADLLVSCVRDELGVAEVPLGSNTGPMVEQFQAATSYAKTQATGWPWCDAFYTWSVRKIGVPDEDNVGTASVALTCQLARTRGWLSPYPAVGAGIAWCGVHIGVVVGMDAAAAASRAAGRQQGLVYTVEGNSGDQVSAHTRTVAGAMFVVPTWLGEVLEPPRLYWIDDPGAKYHVQGPWRALKSATKTQAKLPDALQRRSEVLRTGDGRYVLRIGDDPRRGPFLDIAKRDAALKRLERSLGRQLVPRSTVSHLPPGTTTLPPAMTGGPAEGLGKTT